MKSHPILRKAQYLPLGVLGLYPIILALLTIPWVQKQYVPFLVSLWSSLSGCSV
jgi:hypothetical protein